MQTFAIIVLCLLIIVSVIYYLATKHDAGTMIIVDEPDGEPYIFLEMKGKDTIEKVRKKKYVRMQVEVRTAK